MLHGECMPNTTLLTSPQVAALLKVSLRTVHRAAAAEELPAAQKLPGPNGAFLFDPAVVEQYREAHGPA